MVLAYIKLNKEYKKILEKNNRSKGDLYKIREEQLALAAEETNMIISQAVKKAREIIDSAGIISTDIEKSINGKLEIALKQQEGGFRDKLSSFYDRLELKLDESTREVEDGFKSKLQKDVIGMQEETRGVVENIAKRVQENNQNIDNEFEKYKKNREAMIDKEIQDMVREVTLKAFSSSLTEIQQEKLVIKALEKAKQDGIFKQ